MKVCVIKANVSDDADYEMFTENAVHNTLRQYRKWAKDADIDVEFSLEYDKQGYGLELNVFASFEHEQDSRDFKVNHMGLLPHKKLQITGQNCYFE